ncbi:lipid biosynthesis B12-binding/radical SAM protein [Geomonas sp. RF6]|uniref:lipid biosynthesis B12-binding/radical SAM protein n=1 Tax=Geomonas sp. RF6 TaxID=2897342 RepID=UPI001E5FBFA7|nr:lipid biosynthesis B12-binding/radical SAM protein [Geomonas sp. RF6]UFS69370.1 lipid biosynthesis B12-binding/radical SAM protein [Geomonas sp. RF6]
MRRIFLISTNVTREPYPVYPLGLAAISAALSAAGHEVQQFDMLVAGESRELLCERLKEWNPDFVCVSMRNLDNCDSLSVTGYAEEVRDVIGAVRSVSRAPVIIGGAAFSILPEELLRYTGADYGVVGEGERLICRLVDDLKKGVAAPRLVRNESLLCGPAVPSPLYSEELIAFYRAESGMINLQTKRGCPYDCVYCSYPTLEGKRYRHRDPKTVVDDLVRIQVDHGMETVFFTDSIFNDSEGRYMEVVEEILSRGVSLRWCCYMRPAGIGRTEIALMKRAGLYAVELGTDAACDTTLEGLEKGFTFADALEVNRACVAERLPCAHFVMFGGPGETPETVAEGVANLELLEHTVVCAFSGIRVLPGTKLLDRAVREGVLPEGGSLLEPAYYLSPGVDGAVMNETITEAFRGRRDRIFPPEEGQKRLSIMHRFGYRGLLWDTLIKFPQP